jgi:hypothetical protein
MFCYELEKLWKVIDRRITMMIMAAAAVVAAVAVAAVAVAVAAAPAVSSPPSLEVPFSCKEIQLFFLCYLVPAFYLLTKRTLYWRKTTQRFVMYCKERRMENVLCCYLPFLCKIRHYNNSWRSLLTARVAVAFVFHGYVPTCNQWLGFDNYGV